MSSNDVRAKRSRHDCDGVYSDKTADDGIASSLSSISLDDKAVTESDAVPCPVELRKDKSSSSLCALARRQGIINSTREPEVLPTSPRGPFLSASSRLENHQTLVTQAEAYPPQRPVLAMTAQNLTELEPTTIQWRPVPVEEEPEFFDVAMIYCQEDKELVNKFADILEKFITLDDQQKPRIFRDFLDLRDAFGSHEIHQFDHVLRCSSYAFVFFSRQSVNSEDLKGKCDRTMALHGSITDENCAKVVPVVAEPNLPLGPSFSAYTKISLRTLLGNRTFDLVSVEDLEMKHLDRRLLDRIAKVLNDGRAKRRHKVVNCNDSNFNRSAADKRPTTQTILHTDLIQKNYNALVKSMDVEYGLLTYLFSKCILSFQEMESIQAETARHKMNERLLNTLYLKDAKSFETFVCGLSETNQCHLAELLLHPTK